MGTLSPSFTTSLVNLFQIDSPAFNSHKHFHAMSFKHLTFGFLRWLKHRFLFFLTLPYFSDQAEPAFPESGLILTGKSSASNNKYFFKKLNLFLWKAKSIYVKEKHKKYFFSWVPNLTGKYVLLTTISRNNRKQ